MSRLEYFDAEIENLINLERERQKCTLSLIASECFASEATLEAQGSILANKHSEGYAGNRVCPGSQYIDQIEELAIRRAKKLFGAEHANVQTLSGSIANLAVYLALLDPGDTILAMRRGQGGHFTHGAAANLSGKI